jgi:hypothetical protein
VVVRTGREGIGGNEREPSVRQVRSCGRGECAPRRTREEDHPGARSKLAEEGSLQPLQIGGKHFDANSLGCSDRRALALGEAWERRKDLRNSSKPFGGTNWACESTR